MFSNETIAISADDKTKVNIGTLAVSRHFSINDILQQTTNPKTPIMIFRMQMQKLVPAGYLLLKSRKRRSRSHSSPLTKEWVHTKSKYRSSSAPPNHFSRERNLRGKMFTDALGRDQIRRPRTGSLNVCLHAYMFHNSTSAMHVMLQPTVLGETKKQSPKFATGAQIGQLSLPQIY